MVDAVKLAATVLRLLNKNGRSVTFIQHNTTLETPAEPWDGPADPRATPASTLVLSAVFAHPRFVDRLGLTIEVDDLIRRSDQIMIVSQGNNDLSVFQEVLDGAVYWKITGTEILRPGSTTLLGFVGVKR